MAGGLPGYLSCITAASYKVRIPEARLSQRTINAMALGKRVL